MATRKYHRKTKKSKPDKSKKRIRKTRSKKQGGAKMPYVGPYYENPSAKLWDGVYKNNYKKVEEAFKEGADVNMKHDNGVWFLLVASGHGNARMVNLLLEKGIDINITDYYNNTALSSAVRNAEYDVVELLLEKGADINKENNDGDTPLIHAIIFGDYDMVQLLLEKGADINKENNDGHTPLMRAIISGDYDMVQLLLEHPDIDIELNVKKNKELQLAEEMTPEDEEQNGIPYAIEEYIDGKNLEAQEAKVALFDVANKIGTDNPNTNAAKVLGQTVTVTDKNGNTRDIHNFAREINKYVGGKRKTRKKNSRGRKPRKK